MQRLPTSTIASTDQVIIAANPRAGIGSPTSTVGRLAESLRASGLKVDVLTNLTDMARAAEQTHKNGTLRALVAAGGDGTAAELVNRTSPGIPIAVYPLGTANLLAGYLGIEKNIPDFCQMIVANHVVRFDAGLANGRIFLLMAGCGFDGEVVQRLHQVRAGSITMWSYAKPILDAIRRYEYPELRVYCDTAPEGRPITIVQPLIARWAFVMNLPRYAGGLQFAPEAVGTDGLLDVCTFERGSLWHGLRYLAYVWSRRHSRLVDCQGLLATRVRIESDSPVRYQLDGDPGGMLPLDIEVLPARLTLVAPAPRGAAAQRAHAIPEVIDRA